MNLEQRRTGIGGSDISGIMGAVEPGHPHHKTSYEVYEEKVNGVSRDLSANEAVRWGNMLEEPMAKFYEEKTGKMLFCSSMFRHQKYPFLIANPDRLIVGERKGVEIKTTGYRMRHLWGEDGSRDVPESYYLQIAHYMLVLDYEQWDLIVLIGGQEFREYTFYRDKEIDEMIIESASKFWHDNIEKRVPPPIDYSDKNVQALIRKKYNLVSDEIVTLGDEFIEITNTIEEAEEKIKNYAKIKKEKQSIVLEAMGNAGRAILPDNRCFQRSMVKRKGHTVKESSYVKFSLKGARNDNGD